MPEWGRIRDYSYAVLLCCEGRVSKSQPRLKVWLSILYGYLWDGRRPIVNSIRHGFSTHTRFDEPAVHDGTLRATWAFAPGWNRMSS